MMRINAVQILLGDVRALDEFFWSSSCGLALEQPLDTLECIGLHDPHLISQIFLVAFQFIVNNLLGTLVALDSFSSEHLHVDHRSGNTRWHP